MVAMSDGIGVEGEIRCRICQEVLTTTDEYRRHLLDRHYEELTPDEVDGRVTI